jgi:protein-S-isoprenylcysteine O-methyltransferase Ste14
VLGFAAVAFGKWHDTGLLFFLLICTKNIVAAGLFTFRREPVSQAENAASVLCAYVSAALPLCYFGVSSVAGSPSRLVANILVIAGYSFATLALVELGPCFGIAPAARGRVVSGPYNYLKHPIYAGYAIAEFGMVILNPWNAPIYVCSLLLYRYRAVAEERVLAPRLESAFIRFD